MDNKIICLIGKSGSGKTTIANELFNKYNLKQIISYTTRLPRYKNESSHIFVNKNEFNEIRNDLVAYTYFNQHEYGATSQQVDNNEIYVVDWRGYEELLNKYKGTKKIISIYIHVNIFKLIFRMFKRHDSIKQIWKRILNDKRMFKNVKKNCEYVINNINLEQSVESIWRIWNG